jgi:signal transduction histidine kinase
MLVLLQLFALILLVGLGFYVFVADPRKRAHQTFAAFIAFLAIWTTKDLVFWNFYARESTAGWWVSASFIVALLLQYALVIFAWVFPENARTPKRLAAVIFAPGVVLIPAAILGLLWKTASFADGKLAIDFTPLAYAYVVYVYFVFCFGAAVLFLKYRKYRGSQPGQQLGAILWGLAITVVLKTLANIILPFFGNFDSLPLSAIFVLPGVIIYAYAILNFKLFSLQTALNQFRLFPITYKVALSIALVAVIGFTLFQLPIVWWAFRNGMDAEAWRRYLVFSIITALVPNLLLLLLVLRTISRPLQKITLAALKVTRGGYGTEVDLKKSNDEIGLLADSFNEMSRKMAADIDEMRRLSEQLVRTEKLAAMGTLAAGVAHEVNNPLASVSSLVQMMQSESGHSVETRERLSLIAAQIERIKQVTREMTEFARPRPASRTLVDLNELAASSLRLAQFDMAFDSIDAILERAEDLPQILADEDQMRQVLLNLLLNARDAMPNGGELRLRTVFSPEEVSIEIADSGDGIPEEYLRSIFDPFFTTKLTGKGTGLGLAVCYGIVVAHDGRIEAANSPNGGAVFTITLPRTDILPSYDSQN